MKKIILICLVSVLTIALASPAIVAAKSEEANFGLGGIVGQAGNSHNSFMKLFEKDDTDPEWPIVAEGARGKLKYSLAETTFDFHFNGHGLEFESEYALIYYPDPWPGTGLIIFGTDVADEEGNVHIKGSADIEGILPAEGDTNVTENEGNEGIKIWLVLLSDVGEGAMTGWTPTEYLFEYDLIPVDAPEVVTVTPESTDSNQGNPNKPDKPDKPEQSNNGKGNNK
ncbi:hypothetical protein ACFLYB_06265 [Chloroflexota bacterium]